jgi:hypothetical protein
MQNGDSKQFPFQDSANRRTTRHQHKPAQIDFYPWQKLNNELTEQFTKPENQPPCMDTIHDLLKIVNYFRIPQ